MKKSNWILFALAVIVGIILFICYLYVGAWWCPWDVPLLILWIIIMIITGITLARMEAKRRRILRTMYVTYPVCFNKIAGSLVVANAAEFIEKAKSALAEIDYDKDLLEAPEAFNPNLTVETDDFDLTENKWTGRVRNERTGAEKEFGDMRSLGTILAQM